MFVNTFLYFYKHLRLFYTYTYILGYTKAMR